ncbi:hypothetical protein ACW2AR_003911 [Cronobacter sakazakii]
MDKSREQFLEWFSKEYEEVNNSTELSAQVIKMIASASWQASRAAVEIELPPTTEVHPLGPSAAKVFCELHKNTVAECAKAIRADGLKVKGE